MFKIVRKVSSAFIKIFCTFDNESDFFWIYKKWFQLVGFALDQGFSIRRWISILSFVCFWIFMISDFVLQLMKLELLVFIEAACMTIVHLVGLTKLILMVILNDQLNQRFFNNLKS